MADLIRDFSTARVATKDIGQQVDEMVRFAMTKRKGFERRWYDNNFFDDGHHFRYLSRSSNKIVDLSERATIYAPQRAIPKASRQLRAIANLLVSPDYQPIIYPENIDQTKFPDPQQFQQQMKQAKDYAHKTGRWLIKEWEAQDLIEKLAFMVILAGKHSVSWMQVWPDAVDEAIKTQVYDAFDVVLMGDLTDPEDSPFLGKVTKQLISKIKANELFDPEQLSKITPDNKQASSEIKDAYMNAKFSNLGSNDNAASLLLKEVFVKEYLNQDNRAKIRSQQDGDKILKGKDEGDIVIRQVFVGGNIWLRDKYVNLPGYPFVDFRMEPGPIYSVPLIERFIPINKSLDMMVSRAERFSHTMVTGVYARKQGEQYKMDNTAGGQMIDYLTTPPEPLPIASIPPFYFELMGLMGKLIEEQGASVSLGQIPSGVKAHAAIESLKEQEYSNLVIASRRLKNTVKRIAEKMLDIADNSFVTPQTVYDMKDGNPQYFDVIGASALEDRKRLKVDSEPLNAVPLKKDYKVEIQVEQGVAYTKEGQKAAAKELGDYILELSTQGIISPDVAKIYFKKMLELYSFGETEEMNEALDNPAFSAQISENQLMQIKVALLEGLKEAGEVGPEASQNRIMENKVGMVEALKDTGLTDGNAQNPKDQAEIAKIEQQMQMDKEQHDLEMEKMRLEMEIEAKEAQMEVHVKNVQTAHDMGLKEDTQKTQSRIKATQAAHQMRMSEKMTNAQAKQMKNQPIQKGG